MHNENNDVEKTDTLYKDQIISLMEIYLNEWEHRDSLLWKQAFKFFYANLVVTVLPSIAEFVGISLPPINKKVFPIIGIIMSMVFLYIGIGYAIRLRASSRTYENTMKLLGDEKYCRVSIKDKKHIKFGWMFAFPMAALIIIAMFIALVTTSIVMLIFY